LWPVLAPKYPLSRLQKIFSIVINLSLFFCLGKQTVRTSLRIAPLILSLARGRFTRMTIATANHPSTDPCSVIPKASQPGKSLADIFKPSMHPSLPMSARTGRMTARYTSGTNRRLCAGVVALSTHSTVDSPGHHTHVLVTSSSRHPDRYVLPKGGWEQDESAEQSALREGWEEGTIHLSFSLREI